MGRRICSFNIGSLTFFISWPDGIPLLYIFQAVGHDGYSKDKDRRMNLDHDMMAETEVRKALADGHPRCRTSRHPREPFLVWRAEEVVREYENHHIPTRKKEEEVVMATKSQTAQATQAPTCFEKTIIMSKICLNNLNRPITRKEAVGGCEGFNGA